MVGLRALCSRLDTKPITVRRTLRLSHSPTISEALQDAHINEDDFAAHDSLHIFFGRSSFTTYETFTCFCYTTKMQSFYSDVLRENSVYIAGVIFVGLVYTLYSVYFHNLSLALELADMNPSGLIAPI